MEDLNFDEIKRFDIVKKIGGFYPNVNIPKNHQQWMAKQAQPSYNNKRFKTHRYKQQLDASIYEDLYKNTNYHQTYNYKKEFNPTFAESGNMAETQSKVESINDLERIPGTLEPPVSKGPKGNTGSQGQNGQILPQGSPGPKGNQGGGLKGTI